jgi:hypothetical protein
MEPSRVEFVGGMASLATLPREVEYPPQPPEDHNVTTMDAIARGGREVIVCNKKTHTSRNPKTSPRPAIDCQSPSLLPSATATEFSEDDKIGAWVYKYVCPEHLQMSAQHVSNLLQKARENDLVIDGSRGLFIAGINESY